MKLTLLTLFLILGMVLTTRGQLKVVDYYSTKGVKGIDVTIRDYSNYGTKNYSYNGGVLYDNTLRDIRQDSRTLRSTGKLPPSSMSPIQFNNTTTNYSSYSLNTNDYTLKLNDYYGNDTKRTQKPMAGEYYKSMENTQWKRDSSSWNGYWKNKDSNPSSGWAKPQISWEDN